MSEEEILHIISTRLTIEVKKLSDFYNSRDATFEVSLKLDGDVISTDYFNALT